MHVKDRDFAGTEENASLKANCRYRRILLYFKG